VLDAVLTRLPRPLRDLLFRHSELVKFAVVGGAMFVVDTAIFVLLKSTLLAPKPVTAKIISTIIATIGSYALSRQWSFRTRGGRVPHFEAALFFVVSAIGVGVTAAPLWISRYGLHLEVPYVSRTAQEIADLVSAQIVGTLLATFFRFWAFRRFVFPQADVRQHSRARRAGAAEPAAPEAEPVVVGEMPPDPWMAAGDPGEPLYLGAGDDLDAEAELELDGRIELERAPSGDASRRR
jgi:putative flippase GtrA